MRKILITINDKDPATQFNEHLVDTCLQLADLAENFRPIERIFMTQDPPFQNPGYLEKLCENLRQINLTGCNTYILVPEKLPTEALDIKFEVDQTTMQWKEQRVKEKISEQILKKRLENFIICMRAMFNKFPVFVEIYLTRQGKFYRSLSESKAHESKQVPPANKSITSSRLINELKRHLIQDLKKFDKLSPSSAEEMAESICQELQSSSNLNEELCHIMIPIIFIGRDISIVKDNKRLLLADVQEFISHLANTCTLIHQEMRKPPKIVPTPAKEEKVTKPNAPLKRRHSSPAVFSAVFRPFDKKAHKINETMVADKQMFKNMSIGA